MDLKEPYSYQDCGDVPVGVCIKLQSNTQISIRLGQVVSSELIFKSASLYRLSEFNSWRRTWTTPLLSDPFDSFLLTASPWLQELILPTAFKRDRCYWVCHHIILYLSDYTQWLASSKCKEQKTQKSVTIRWEFWGNRPFRKVKRRRVWEVSLTQLWHICRWKRE